MFQNFTNIFNIFALFVDKPIIKITIKPQQVNLTEGHSGIICCEWTSNPPGIMTTWLKNSLQRQNGNQKCLKFSPFLRNDSGSFTCVVKNTIGQSRLSTELTIFCKYNHTNHSEFLI